MTRHLYKGINVYIYRLSPFLNLFCIIIVARTEAPDEWIVHIREDVSPLYASYSEFMLRDVSLLCYIPTYDTTIAEIRDA